MANEHTPPVIPSPPPVSGSRQYRRGFADGWAQGYWQGYLDTLAVELTHMHPHPGDACEDGVYKEFDHRPLRHYINIPDKGSHIPE